MLVLVAIELYKYNRDKNLTTIIVEKTTRENLKRMARKDQKYDDLIRELMQLRGLKFDA
ncbi:MAG: hypothetical protein ABJB85_09180 [Nitrososphaerota archaeon]